MRLTLTALLVVVIGGCSQDRSVSFDPRVSRGMLPWEKDTVIEVSTFGHGLRSR